MTEKSLLLKFKEDEQNLSFYGKVTLMLEDNICSFLSYKVCSSQELCGFCLWSFMFPVP